MAATDTIYALSSGSLPSGVAVVRISGSGADNVLTELAGKLPPPRVASLAVLRDRRGEELDRALVINYPGSTTFTGEPVVELHLHGGRAVVHGVLAAIAEIEGTRPAEPGEFTRRAFINGKMDLTAAEGVADLIAAETEAQRRLALRNASGAQQVLYSSWRSQLIEARAMIEADLDFSDEGDVPGSVADQVIARVADLRAELNAHLLSARSGEIVREGFRVVIAGEPNAGKSSLLNALARREVAIVSDEAGTTRDILEVALDLDGYKVVLTDTAGLREAENKVERIGVAKARSAMDQADLILHLHPAGFVHPHLETRTSTLNVSSKSDLRDSPDDALTLSTTTGDGISNLLDILTKRVAAETSSAEVMPTQQRHVALLQSASARLAGVASGIPLELQAEELRLAADALGRVTGAIGVEDLLDVIFSRFCIGK